MCWDLQSDELTAGHLLHATSLTENTNSLKKKKKWFVCLLQEKQFHVLSSDVVEKEKYVGSETPVLPPTSIKRKETLWSEVPYVLPHQSE